MSPRCLQTAALQYALGLRIEIWQVSAMAKVYDSKYWQARADEARARAAEMRDPETRDTLTRIAAMYDSLACRPEEATQAATRVKFETRR